MRGVAVTAGDVRTITDEAVVRINGRAGRTHDPGVVRKGRTGFQRAPGPRGPHRSRCHPGRYRKARRSDAYFDLEDNERAALDKAVNQLLLAYIRTITS